MKKLVFEDLDDIKFTIITVVFNGAKYLSHAIESVINQQYKKIEYIVIDGGSNDGTLEVIKKYDKYIDCWVSEKDEGISDAFNKGLKRASGNFIGILNADDFYEQDALQIIHNNIKESPGYEIYYGLTDMIDGGGNSNLLPLKNSHLFLEQGMTLCHPSVFVKNKSYQKYGMFNKDYKIAMDYELLLRHRKLGSTFKFVNSKIATHRPGGKSQMLYHLGLKECSLAQALHLNNIN